MTILGAQSRQFFIDVAQSIGYKISISEYRVFVVGIDRCGDSRTIGDGTDPMYDEWGNKILNTRGKSVEEDELSQWPQWGLGPPTNRFYWTVHVEEAKLVWFRCASGQCGVDPHLRIGLADDLECLLNRWKPGHTQIIFDYSNLGGNEPPVITAPDFIMVGGAGGGGVPSSGLRSSAGVFNSSGALVRTLWSAEKDHPSVANPGAAWDGTLDDGTVAPSGTYNVKTIEHDVKYIWDGAVGNSSPDHNTARYHAYGSVIRDMAITAAGEIYFSTVYDERIQTARVTTITDIQNSDSAFPPQVFRQAMIATHAVCTDGTIAYFGLTANATESGVRGTTCAGHTAVTFANGTVVGTISYLGLDTTASYGGQITGLAVQKTGVHIFLAKPNKPAIAVYNKTTGASVSTFTTLAHPRRLASNPVTITELWVANDANGDGKAETVVKCAVSGGGTITTTATTIACQDALALAISPDGTTLLIADGGTTQQVRAFNTSDGTVKSAWAISGALGTLGGYVNSPTVTNTKFMFYAVSDMGSLGPQAFLAYQADGKFWVGDVGNCRYLRFTAGNSPAYDDGFSYIPGFYPCRVCKGDATRVFANFLEYQIDYSKPLLPTNGSWVLSKNWMGNLSANELGAASYNRLKFVGVYPNGRTYGMVDMPGIAMRRVFELTATGLRSTGWNVVPQHYIDANMDAYEISNAAPGQVCTIKKNPFTGFDASGNPSWANNDAVAGNTTALGGTVTVFTSQTLPAKFPRTKGHDNNMVQPMEALSNGVIPFFDPNTGDDPGWFNNHFGTIDATTGVVKSNTHPLTPTLTGGTGNFNKVCLFYPPAPYIPYNIYYGGGPPLYVPGHAHVFTVFNGEEWGNNQTNVITHWHESGLALANFGPAAPYFGAMSTRHPDLAGDDIPADSPYSWLGLPGMAGNSRWGGIASVGGKYYIYQNDEWYHGGVVRWHVENLNSLVITNHSVAWNSGSYVAPSDPPDMLAGLTADVVLVDGQGGWHRTHAEGADFKVNTSVINCDKRHPGIGVFGKFFTDDVLRGAYRALTRSGSGDWTLSGDIFMHPGYTRDGNPFVGGLILFDVLDNAGKVIVRWYAFTRGESDLAGTVVVNGVDLFPIPAGGRLVTQVYTTVVRPFSIQSNIAAGTVTLIYDTYQVTVPVFEAGAAVGSPATVRIAHDAHNSGGEPATVLTKLRFV